MRCSPQQRTPSRLPTFSRLRRCFRRSAKPRRWGAPTHPPPVAATRERMQSPAGRAQGGASCIAGSWDVPCPWRRAVQPWAAARQSRGQRTHLKEIQDVQRGAPEWQAPDLDGFAVRANHGHCRRRRAQRPRVDCRIGACTAHSRRKQAQSAPGDPDFTAAYGPAKAHSSRKQGRHPVNQRSLPHRGLHSTQQPEAEPAPVPPAHGCVPKV
jgi:hypothetical protein